MEILKESIHIGRAILNFIGVDGRGSLKFESD